MSQLPDTLGGAARMRLRQLAGALAALMIASSAVGLGVGEGGAATRSRQLHARNGYALLTIARAVHDLNWDGAVTVGDGGGVVSSLQAGLSASGRPRRLHCRIASVDLSGKTPFQSDPSGVCSANFPVDRVITLIAQPDFRSRVLGWERFASEPLPIVAPKCARTEATTDSCIVHAHAVKLVVGGTSTLWVGFRLRLFRLSVMNHEPGFGEAEDHGRGQYPLEPSIDCGLGYTSCSADYEFGSRPVLDALWDTSKSLTVTWESCDPVDPITSNRDLCPVTMTRNRIVSVSWP
jgi:hypothetical protein